MKKFLLLAAICFCFISCGEPLRENGQFSSEQYIGSFRDIAIYRVMTPDGQYLYLGVRENGDLASTQYTTGGKVRVTVPVIMIDGKKTSVEEAKKMLEEYK